MKEAEHERLAATSGGEGYFRKAEKVLLKCEIAPPWFSDSRGVNGIFHSCR